MTRVKLTDIAFDAGTQIRAAIDQQVVTDYADAMTSGATFPPIALFHDGTQHYLADGFHRFLAAQRNAFREIDADVQAGTKDDALWFALGANRTNGKRLSETDKRSAALLALQTWPHKSARMVAEQIGCSAALVSTVKSGLSSPDDPPTRVTTRSGGSYPSSPSAAVKAREVAAQMLRDGAAVDVVQRTTGIGRDTMYEIRRGLGLSVDKTKAGIRHRREQMRTMAAAGHTSRQIAAAVGLSEDTCRETLRREGVDVPADKVTRGTHRHDSNRIVERIVMDAENLIEGLNLIEFTDLDSARLKDWLRSLSESRDKFSGFIRRLMKEQQRNGEAA